MTVRSRIQLRGKHKTLKTNHKRLQDRLIAYKGVTAALLSIIDDKCGDKVSNYAHELVNDLKEPQTD